MECVLRDLNSNGSLSLAMVVLVLRMFFASCVCAQMLSSLCTCSAAYLSIVGVTTFEQSFEQVTKAMQAPVDAKRACLDVPI